MAAFQSLQGIVHHQSITFQQKMKITYHLCTLVVGSGRSQQCSNTHAGSKEEEHRLRQECSCFHSLVMTSPGSEEHHKACAQLSSLQVSNLRLPCDQLQSWMISWCDVRKVCQLCVSTLELSSIIYVCPTRLLNHAYAVKACSGFWNVANVDRGF